jgi:uncharacterized protein (DUF362 family)
MRTALYGSLFLNIDNKLFSLENTTPDLAVVQGGTPDLITSKAIDLLGGIKQFVSKGDVVMIKPNIAFNRTPEQAGCTNPEVVRILVKLCIDAGAKEVKVMDNPVSPAQETYKRSGIEKAAKEAGAIVLYPEPDRLKSVSIKGAYLDKQKVFTDIIEADKIINVPILKTHGLTRLTMGMKNWLGAIGGNRDAYHSRLERVIVDLSRFFKPALIVLDAYRVLAKNGPAGKTLSDVVLLKTVVAGRDIVAVDAMGASLCQVKPKSLGFLKLAYKQGLGEIDLNSLKIDIRTTRSP